MSIWQRILIGVLVVVLCTVLVGYLANSILTHLSDLLLGASMAVLFDAALFLDPMTYVIGFAVSILLVILYSLYSTSSSKNVGKLLSGKAKAIDGALENSRFMTDKERNETFKLYKFSKIQELKKDGVPVRAICKGRDMQINLASPMHALVIGSTGSGKTTAFVNPMIQILAASSAGSSMVVTDPKGELFQLHSKFLKERGYNCMVLDLRDPYSSFKWNPLEDLYDRYQLYLSIGNDIYKRRDRVEGSGLEILDPVENYGEVWYEYEGRAYSDGRVLLNEIKVARQKIYDEVYEDLNDLMGVLCPIESKDDPVWEKGARAVITAVVLAMLEDSENPELEMTKEKFNFYNLNKAIGNSDNNFEQLKNYFAGRSVLSNAVNLSKQVLSAAENTLASYMSMAFDKMTMFNDEGLCSLTSKTEINPTIFADEPTALFLKVPDEKDTRHSLAAVFVLCIYKALIKKASSREDLTLPRNVYFILDEFGNMPRIDKFDKMITVGRSRKIWFTMIVQSYAQLNNVYGDKVAAIVKSNCGIKMFIGSNDIETCEEFSKLCGNMTVSTQSVSSSSAKDQGENISTSSQIQTRPLIYPSELQRLNNAKSTGNSIIVTFGNFPLKTQFTPSYKCSLYKFGQMDLTKVRSQAFFGDEVYYDLGERNYIVLERDSQKKSYDDDDSDDE